MTEAQNVQLLCSVRGNGPKQELKKERNKMNVSQAKGLFTRTATAAITLLFCLPTLQAQQPSGPPSLVNMPQAPDAYRSAYGIPAFRTLTNTIKGELTISKYTFISDPDDPLVFDIDAHEGYLYERGRGIVVTPAFERVFLRSPLDAIGLKAEETAYDCCPFSVVISPDGHHVAGPNTDHTSVVRDGKQGERWTETQWPERRLPSGRSPFRPWLGGCDEQV